MQWSFGLPNHQGQFIVVDRMYHSITDANWRPDLGWCIRGRWLGHDAVDCWIDVGDLPPIPEQR
jgi:hypothetical protein